MTQSRQIVNIKIFDGGFQVSFIISFFYKPNYAKNYYKVKSKVLIIFSFRMISQ